jgi:hypothetical protein
VKAFALFFVGAICIARSSSQFAQKFCFVFKDWREVMRSVQFPKCFSDPHKALGGDFLLFVVQLLCFARWHYKVKAKGSQRRLARRKFIDGLLYICEALGNGKRARSSIRSGWWTGESQSAE